MAMTTSVRHISGTYLLPPKQFEISSGYKHLNMLRFKMGSRGMCRNDLQCIRTQSYIGGYFVHLNSAHVRYSQHGKALYRMVSTDDSTVVCREMVPV